jgi:hypothetical protein
MTEDQAKFLLYKAAANHLNIEIPEETLKLWIERLAHIPFQQGLRNLDNFMDKYDYFPKISNVIGLNSNNDKEIESRNHEIAFSQFVRGGGKPEDFMYVRDRAAGVKELGS